MVVACRMMGSMRDGETVKLLTLTAVAKATGLSRSTVHRLVDRGELPHVEVGVRRRVPFVEVTRWIEGSLVCGEEPPKLKAMTVQERKLFAKPLGKALARPVDVDDERPTAPPRSSRTRRRGCRAKESARHWFVPRALVSVAEVNTLTAHKRVATGQHMTALLLDNTLRNRRKNPRNTAKS